MFHGLDEFARLGFSEITSLPSHHRNTLAPRPNVPTKTTSLAFWLMLMKPRRGSFGRIC